MRVMLKQGQKMGLKVLTLSAFASNKRAFHVYEKVGFVQIGLIPKSI
jgi:ribosomal protein S18 acetylase RimI-like enzyme